MKKLFAILGAMTLTASVTSFAVSCTKNNNKEETGSTFIDANGDLKIDSEALMNWYQQNKKPNPTKQIKDFFRYFAVAIMQDATKNEESKFAKIKSSENKYFLDDFQSQLKKAWGKKNDTTQTTVQGAANVAFEKLENDNGKKDNKNWQKNLTDLLAKQFPYVKKEFESLKRAWINNEILNNKQDSAEAKLKNILITNYQDIKFQDNNSNNNNILIDTFISNWKDFPANKLTDALTTFVNKISQDIDNKKEIETINKAKYFNLLNLLNATGGIEKIAQKANNSEIKKWSLNKIKWANNKSKINGELVEDLLYRLNTNWNEDKDKDQIINKESFKGSRSVDLIWEYVDKNGNKKINTYFDLVDRTPVIEEFDNLRKQDSPVHGFVSNSQKFLIDQFFQIQKPLSVNEMVFKATDSTTLKNNITGMGFLSPKDSSSDTWKQFYGFYNFLNNYILENMAPSGNEKTIERKNGITEQIKGTSQYNVDTIFGNSNKDNVGKIYLNVNENEDPYWDNKFFEIKNNENLLTLSSDKFSNILKYSVYDFIQASKKNKLKKEDIYAIKENSTPVEEIATKLITEYGFINTSIAENIQHSIKNASPEKQGILVQSLFGVLDLINDLNRKVINGQEYKTSDNQSNNNIYKVLNLKQGIIAFIDPTDGLHIAKINGFDALIAPEEKQKSVLFENEQDKENYIKQTNIFKRLNEYVQNDNSGTYRYIFQDYKNNIQTSEIENDSFSSKLISPLEIENVKNYGISYNDLNPQFTNSYQRFLVNNSILSSEAGTNHENNPSFYKFDIFKEVNNSIADVDDKLSDNNSWIWDYLKSILNFNSNSKSDWELISTFFEFENTNDSAKFKQEISRILQRNSRETKRSAFRKFKNGWNKWNDEIDETKVGKSQEDKEKPLSKLAWGKLENGELKDQTHLDDLNSLEIYKPYKVENVFVFKIENNWVQNNFVKRDERSK